MAMASNAAALKIINFQYGDKTFRSKFSTDTSAVELDEEIRNEFNIELGTTCGFVDMADNTRVLLSVLKHLPNDANIMVIVKDSNSRTNLSSDTQRLSPSSSSSIINNSDGMITIMNSVKDISSSSESTNNSKTNLTYYSTIPPTGQKQHVNANTTTKVRKTKVAMNQKVYYFLETYAGIERMNCIDVSKQIMARLDIKIYELYNLLKYIRNKVDIPSLNMNKTNAANIIVKLHDTDYLNSRNKCRRQKRAQLRALECLAYSSTLFYLRAQNDYDQQA
ncbi:unnamed protein product [Rotaria sp. Silwood2]|nr:unnamed protein product [Rotaria sp. Silwood2]CAF4439053.1 unnamed protein product [Rotaria sp. Silwood2]